MGEQHDPHSSDAFTSQPGFRREGLQSPQPPDLPPPTSQDSILTCHLLSQQKRAWQSSFPPFALLLRQHVLCQVPRARLPSGASCVMVRAITPASLPTLLATLWTSCPRPAHLLIPLSNLPVYTDECCSQRGESPRQDTASLQPVNSTESSFFLSGSSGSALVLEVADHFYPLEGSSQPPSLQILPHPGESALGGLLCSPIHNTDPFSLLKMSLANQAKE